MCISISISTSNIFYKKGGRLSALFHLYLCGRIAAEWWIFMKCPYCGEEMKLGRIYGEGEHAVFWLPEHTDYKKWLLSQKRIKDSGGVMLDSATKVGFFAMAKPESYWCETCRIFITRTEYLKDME